MELNYIGLLRSPVSWAKIGRELIREFISQGYKLYIIEKRGFRYNKNFSLPDEFKKYMVKKEIALNTLTFDYPLNYDLILSPNIYGMLVYETTEVPQKWVEMINKKLKLLFLPSKFNEEIFKNSGVKKKISVIPYGINPDLYNNLNELKTDNKFRFLTIAMPQKRKGIDILISAFEKLFKNNKNVELIIKFPYEPGKSRYDIKINVNAKNIHIITKEMKEEDVVKLYKSSHCFVLPSRAEGFGMVYLESLACGTPVIATGWGGHLDFLNSNNSLLLNYKLIPAKEIQYDNLNGNGLMAEPDINDLMDKMIYVYKNYEKEKEKIKNINLNKYYWRNIVNDIKNIIKL